MNTKVMLWIAAGTVGVFGLVWLLGKATNTDGGLGELVTANPKHVSIPRNRLSAREFKTKASRKTYDLET